MLHAHSRHGSVNGIERVEAHAVFGQDFYASSAKPLGERREAVVEQPVVVFVIKARTPPSANRILQVPRCTGRTDDSPAVLLDSRLPTSRWLLRELCRKERRVASRWNAEPAARERGDDHFAGLVGTDRAAADCSTGAPSPRRGMCCWEIVPCRSACSVKGPSVLLRERMIGPAAGRDARKLPLASSVQRRADEKPAGGVVRVVSTCRIPRFSTNCRRASEAGAKPAASIWRQGLMILVPSGAVFGRLPSRFTQVSKEPGSRLSNWL